MIVCAVVKETELYTYIPCSACSRQTRTAYRNGIASINIDILLSSELKLCNFTKEYSERVEKENTSKYSRENCRHEEAMSSHSVDLLHFEVDNLSTKLR